MDFNDNKRKRRPFISGSFVVFVVVVLFIDSMVLIVSSLATSGNYRSGFTYGFGELGPFDGVSIDTVDSDTTYCDVVDTTAVYGSFTVQQGEPDYSFLSERELTEYDVDGLSSRELELMRNSIYARYGYRFKRDDLLDYFLQFSWYSPTTSDMSEVYNMMSDIERYNVNFIRLHE